ncbi:hypothetical protein BDZ94DRAFT_1280427 [Collybia nuda]|uniref:CCHC-type domain-containing protein n=1 Tax=Collybia nuda TaxID=64659 RepID=A0A9P5YEX4_9AGAR|nr:hypothetical protein BDZ94DRAFT_1280427 [Collybia nuda]
MTRVTNFGRKRTYVESGIGHQADIEATQPDKITNVDPVPEEMTEAVAPPKKKRKRTKMSKRDGNAAAKATISSGGEGENSKNDVPEEKGEEGTSEIMTPRPTLSKSAKKKKREKERKSKILSASEVRRQRRINEKMAGTICFACREKGHAAKDCPVTKDMADDGGSSTRSKGVVGICYRCGSTRHTLSRCKKSINDANPLPFASCFVCNGKGHLASSCPQNKAKGIYPNGGCCKLCGDTSHLARDCGLRKRDNVDNSTVLGVSREAGADEDDFHVFKRHTTELNRGEKQEEKIKRSLDIKAGASSGIIKPFGNVSKPSTKKVVHF